MKGVSEVIAIILILMITISLAGLAYMFMSTTMSDVTSSAGSTVDTTTSSMLTSFRIESIDISKVYVRNTGQNALTSLSVYVNDEPATFNVSTPIAVGAIGTVTIYSFIPDGATVKIISPNGFSTSKVANPCEKAAACWKFDEGSGTVAYDSSPNGFYGTISGATWTRGKYGNALSFDGSNDYVDTQASTLLNLNEQTVEVVFWVDSLTGIPQGIVGKDITGSNNWILYRNAGDTAGSLFWLFYYTKTDATTSYIIPNTGPSLSQWTHLALISNSTGYWRIYRNGVFISSGQAASFSSWRITTASVRMGGITGYYANGKVDEVRIYNRAIY